METKSTNRAAVFSTLFFSLFATVTGVGIVVPLLPIYARNLGAKGIYIALIFGGFSLSRSFFLPIFGRLSDRKGRKHFILFGLFSYFLISLAFMLTHSVNALIGLRIIQGVASAMIMPVAQAYVGDISPEGKEGFFMGIFNMSVFFGLSIGPLLGGVIKDHWGLQAAFGTMGGLALAAFLSSLAFLPSPAKERSAVSGYHPVRWRTLLQDRIIISISLFRFVYTTCIGIIWGFLPIYADSSFKLSGSSIGILLMTGISISGLIHVPMGIVADNRNKRYLVIFGGGVVVIAMIIMGAATGFTDLFASNVIFGIGGGIAIPSLTAMAVIRGNKQKAMGSVMALVTTAHSLGMMAGSLLAGAIMDLFCLKYAFFAGGVIMAAGMLLFFTGTRSSSLTDS
ncbi:MAG: MFS transporter [Deltaproteobacteria bacterium]|nr:MFS transporter [Deltaproteobacteria bacterium]